MSIVTAASDINNKNDSSSNSSSNDSSNISKNSSSDSSSSSAHPATSTESGEDRTYSEVSQIQGPWRPTHDGLCRIPELLGSRFFKSFILLFIVSTRLLKPVLNIRGLKSCIFCKRFVYSKRGRSERLFFYFASHHFALIVSSDVCSS